MSNRSVGVKMLRFLSLMIIALVVSVDVAEANIGCVSTPGINGGCVACSSSGCSLTGPNMGGDFGNGTIIFDGGSQANCENGICLPTGAGGTACIGGGIACFSCSTSGGCDLQSISASSLGSGVFGDLNLQNFLGLGNHFDLLNVSGLNVNNGLTDVFSSLLQLPQSQLSDLLNQNADLRNLINVNINNGALGGLGQQLSDRINGIGGQLNTGALGDLGNIFPGGVLGGGSGGELPLPSVVGGPNQSVTAGVQNLAKGDAFQKVFAIPEETDLRNKFDEWSPTYRGINRSSILFDGREKGAKRAYPEIGDSKEHRDGERPSYDHVNLGVDDEVRKAGWAIYQNIGKMTEDALNDELERDNYLDGYKSTLGVAQTTLAFLDQTVATSLNQVKGIANDAVTNQLLKQISWSASKTANPNRADIYQDVDEKLEACLLGERGYGGDEDDWKRINFDEIACDSKCDAKLQGGDTYAACVCCSEVSQGINNTLALDDTKNDPKYQGVKSLDDRESGWSLVDKVLFGTRFEKGRNSHAEESFAAISGVRNAIKELYGDIIVIQEGPVLKYSYKQPAYSLSQKIHRLRDNCGGEGSVGASGVSQQNSATLACPVQGIHVKHGICPSIVKLIIAYPAQTDEDFQRVGGKEAYNEYLLEASLGTVLTNGNILWMRSLGNLGDKKLPNDWTPGEEHGDLYRFLTDYCDAAAYAAINRFDVNLRSVVYDHLQINNRATGAEKARFMKLIDRFRTNFLLAEEGVGREDHLVAMLGSLGGRFSRESARGLGTVYTSMGSRARQASNIPATGFTGGNGGYSGE